MNKFLKSKGPRWSAIAAIVVVLAMVASVVLGWFGGIGDWFMLLGQLIQIGFGYGIYMSVYSMVLTFREIALERKAATGIAPRHFADLALAPVAPILVVGFYVWLTLFWL